MHVMYETIKTDHICLDNVKIWFFMNLSFYNYLYWKFKIYKKKGCCWTQGESF